MRTARLPEVALGLLLAAIPLQAWNCAAVPPAGMTVQIAEESAVIIWDEASKTQHFIRRGKFDTKAKDFGFLVPTPTQPELAEADDKVFSHLVHVTRPREVIRKIPADVKAAAPPRPAAAPVTVLATAKVAGLDATVLEASDAIALDTWLKKHGYASGPELIEWFKPYIAARWKITAFKIDVGASVSDSAVRMSFRTERPFFPYREPAYSPAAEKQRERLLRVYFVANARFDGVIGSAGVWPGKAVWAGRMDEKDHAKILSYVKLPDAVPSRERWLTEFEDGSSPRPGTDDLFFARSTSQSTLERPPTVIFQRVDGMVFDGEFFVVAAILLGLLVGAIWLLYLLIRTVVRQFKKKPESP